jgi:hypothetical protein
MLKIISIGCLVSFIIKIWPKNLGFFNLERIWMGVVNIRNLLKILLAWCMSMGLNILILLESYLILMLVFWMKIKFMKKFKDLLHLKAFCWKEINLSLPNKCLIRLIKIFINLNILFRYLFCLSLILLN